MAYRRTPRIQARLDAQRAMIVRAAIELVSTSGYGAATVVAVAGRAGVATGTVYNHFADKAELFAEVFRVVVEHEVRAVQAATEPLSAAADQVVGVIETFADRALKSPRLAFALLVEPADPSIDALRLQFRRAFTDLVAAAVTAGVASGELPPQNPAVAAAAVVGAVGEVLIDPLGTGSSAPDTVDALVRFALRGIGAPDGPHP